MSEELPLRQCLELAEGQVVIRGDTAVIMRLWACYHAVVGIPTRPLQDGVLTALFAALVDVLTTGKFDGDVFVCRSGLVRRVAHEAVSLWPASVDLRIVERADAPQRRAPVDASAWKAVRRR